MPSISVGALFLPRVALLTIPLPSSQGDPAGCFDTSVRFHLPIVACSSNCYEGNSDQCHCRPLRRRDRAERSHTHTKAYDTCSRASLFLICSAFLLRGYILYILFNCILLTHITLCWSSWCFVPIIMQAHLKISLYRETGGIFLELQTFKLAFQLRFEKKISLL